MPESVAGMHTASLTGLTSTIEAVQHLIGGNALEVLPGGPASLVVRRKRFRVSTTTDATEFTN